MQTIHIDSLDELPHAAAAVINALEGRSVVVFRGEMGAGKTTLIREIVARLGADDTVTSPTFASSINIRPAKGRISITSISTGSTGSKRLTTSATKNISTPGISVWSNGPRRSKSCCPKR